MQVNYCTREAPLGSYTERETQIKLGPQETNEFEELLRDLLHKPYYETLAPYQQELVEDLFLRLTKTPQSQTAKGR